MFIILLTYKKDLAAVDQYLAAHRAFLDIYYQKGFFVASGPQNPRTGGVLISQLRDKLQLEEVLKQDPFYVKGITDYEIIEFNPVKYHPDFASFCE